jgi:hypothetical protein
VKASQGDNESSGTKVKRKTGAANGGKTKIQIASNVSRA